MNTDLMLHIGVMMFGVLISSVSQVMLKKAALRSYDSPLKEYLNPLVIGAYTLFVLATLCSVYAYRTVPLSAGAVIEASGYIYVTASGVLFFKEKLTKRGVLSLILIISGIILYAIG